MAKRKHSTALFEVITKTQPYAKPRERGSADAGLLSSAGRWFKRQIHVEPQTARESAPRATSVAVPATPIASLTAPIAMAHSTLTLVQTPPEDIAPPPALEGGGFEEGEPASAPSAKVTMAVDYESRQISLRMSYATALVSAAVVVLVVGLTIVLLQHMGRSSALLLAEKTTDKIRAGPAQRDVMDVQHRSAYSPSSAGNSSGTGESAPIATGPAGNRNPADARPPVPSVAGDGKRYIGLNYVIVQSYPLAEEKMAKEAVALLNKEGIPCTLETGVRGYLPLTVVGLQGFDKQSSPAFKVYVQRIQQMSAKAATSNHSYKAFAPVAKKWDKQD